MLVEDELLEDFAVPELVPVMVPVPLASLVPDAVSDAVPDVVPESELVAPAVLRLVAEAASVVDAPVVAVCVAVAADAVSIVLN